MQTLEKRNLHNNLKAGKGFVTCPGDVFTIESTPGCLSSNISVHVTNTGTMNDAAILTDEYVGLPNILDAWKMLKQLNDMGGRTVLHQVGDETPVPYEESGPYMHRFGKTTKRGYTYKKNTVIKAGDLNL